jgi:uncharacterized RDD family membrane protein YckC
MSSALDEVLDNKQAQEFWLRRLIAFLMDVIIIYVPISIMVSIAWTSGFLNQPVWLLSGALLIVYTALFESELGYTIGKRIMGLEVVSLDPRIYDIRRGLIRNISKIHPVLLLIDMLLGLLERDRVNMRYVDTVVATEVVDSQVAEWRREQGLAPPVGDGVVPPVTVQPDADAGEPTMPPEDVEEPEAPQPPDEDELVEVEPEEEEGAPGIAPPPIPEEEPDLEKDSLEEVSMDEIMAEVPEEEAPAYKMPPKEEPEE